ncbi:hypothetical protein GOV08_02275 [Candidatus Woesearchaeota archaeon]|nr:hypothetical protein [Candidatus Woesearchaeota archaeon]
MRGKAAFLLAFILSSTSAYALDANFKVNIVKYLGQAMSWIVEIVRVPVIRQGLSVIALVVIFNNIFREAVRKIHIFANHPNRISMPVSILSTFAIYTTVNPEVIERMFLYLIIAVLVIFHLKLFMKLYRKIAGRFRPRRAINAQRNVAGQTKENRVYGGNIQESSEELGDEIKDEKKLIADNDAALNLTIEEAKELEKIRRKILKRIQQKGD